MPPPAFAIAIRRQQLIDKLRNGCLTRCVSLDSQPDAPRLQVIGRRRQSRQDEVQPPDQHFRRSIANRTQPRFFHSRFDEPIDRRSGPVCCGRCRRRRLRQRLIRPVLPAGLNVDHAGHIRVDLRDARIGSPHQNPASEVVDRRLRQPAFRRHLQAIVVIQQRLIQDAAFERLRDHCRAGGPCELTVESVDSARLLAGTVFVDVTEVSNGFLLETPEAKIIDEGTQYAVTLDSQATEVHVFDGSVIWTPTRSDADFEDRITTGEARRYLRSEPARSHHIPFGQRQFVRRIEERVREAGGGNLLAYDGFENLAGQLRRGRSGFGWTGGWVSAGRGRGPLAEIIDAPDDVVFGVDRSGRRLLSLRGGDDLRRSFESPIELSSRTSIFLSLLVSRPSPAGEEDTAIQVFLEPESASPRFTRRHLVSFGVRSDGQPFVNNAGTIDVTAVPLSDGEAHLFVFKLEAAQNTTKASLRVYRAGEFVDATQPSAWMVHGTASPGPTVFTSIRISLGTQAAVQVDELRLANSWSAAVNVAN